MKKIVSNSLVIGSQLLIGGLFLVMLFSPSSEANKKVVVENNNLYKMTDSVTELFITEPIAVKEEKQIKKEEKQEVINNDEPPKAVEAPIVEDKETVIKTYTGVLTGYGPDCYGCTSGMTNSGYDVSNTITYNDPQYGEIRIVAADPSIALYSIVRISNLQGYDPIIAIVLDRGSNVGFERATLFDLLFPSEAQALHKTPDVTFEMLRIGK